TGFYSDEGYDLQQTADGGFVITGETGHEVSGATQTDVLLVKTDHQGDTVWMKFFDLFGKKDVGRSVHQTYDGDYIIAGYTSLNFNDHDAFLIKTDETGNLLWMKNFGRNLGTYPYDEAYSVKQTTDGGFITAGWSYDINGNKSDVYLVKFSPETVGTAGITQNQNILKVSPNPMVSETCIAYSLKTDARVHLSIFNDIGKEIETLVDEDQPSGEKQVFWYGKNSKGEMLNPGMFFVRLEINGQVHTAKLILLK
ncbi:MAG: hypothetical protein ACLFPE_10785, partial [Bacteroidales bacterium]